MYGGTIADAGIGLTAVGAPHFSAAEAEEFLRGAPASEASFARAGELAAASCRPVSDQRGPADYKRHLARELTVRSLRRAWQRAGQHVGQGAGQRVGRGAGQGAGQRAGQQSAG
jgi:carbon-monoxide dehydrogenase medium subunit